MSKIDFIRDKADPIVRVFFECYLGEALEIAEAIEVADDEDAVLALLLRLAKRDL